MIDYYKARLYGAEAQAFFACEQLATSGELMRLILDSFELWWRTYRGTALRYGSVRRAHIIFDGDARTATAFLRTGTIRIGAKMQYRWAALHEVAHLLAGEVKGQGHGRRFCSIYLWLVKKQMGELASEALKEQFKRFTVSFQDGELAWPD